MASEQKLPLRLLVDKERNRVILAEASGDFIDILFSFLTLPLGTIIRLVSKKPHHDQEQDIGCINNLYHSVENSSDEVFLNQICKKMLLSPHNPCGSLCKKLKLRVDDTEEMKYFMCTSCGRDGLLSTFAGAKCSCGKVMEKEMKFYEDSSKENQVDGVFVREGIMFLIFDDLRVLQSSPGNSVQQLVQLGYKNFNKLTEMFLNVGLKEILDLLKQALISKSALSDVFLENRESKRINTFSPKLPPINEPRRIVLYSINLKLTVTKSKRKILYAEAEADFIDFLFSFLTTPQGSILELLERNTSVGCMTNLYKSVKDLNPSWFTRPSVSPLLNLRVANQFGCRAQPLKLREEDTPFYYYGSGVLKNNLCYVDKNGVISREKNMINQPVAVRVFDPRSHDGTRESAVGFVKRPSLFVVWDDLKVTPLENTSSISFLQKLNAPLDDLEEHDVKIGETEALNLFGASLTSKSALTDGLCYLVWKPKEEAQV